MRARNAELESMSQGNQIDDVLLSTSALRGYNLDPELEDLRIDSWLNDVADVEILAAHGNGRKATGAHEQVRVYLGSGMPSVPVHSAVGAWYAASVSRVPVRGALLRLASGPIFVPAGTHADCSSAAVSALGGARAFRCTIGGREHDVASLDDAEELADNMASSSVMERKSQLGLSGRCGRGRSLNIGRAWSGGNRTVLVIRLRFNDQTDATPSVPTDSTISALMLNATIELTRMSYGQVNLITTLLPTLYALPFASGSSFTTESIRAAATSAAATAGFTPNSYQHFIMALPPNSLGGFAGLGSVLGSSVWLTSSDYRSTSDLTTVIHELGHNFGLKHASFSSYVDGTWTEYGSQADAMGAGSDVKSVHDFGAGYKHGLDWLSDADVLTLAAPVNGTAAAAGPSTVTSLPSTSSRGAVTVYTSGTRSSTSFLLRPQDLGVPSAPSASRAFLAFRVGSALSVVPDSGDRFLYGGYQSRVPYASKGVILTEVPLSPTQMGNALVYDASPFTSSQSDSELDSGSAVLYDSEGQRLLMENIGFGNATAGDGPMLSLRASYLTSDLDRPEGGGCTVAGKCKGAVPNAATAQRVTCGSTTVVQVDELNDVAVLLIDGSLTASGPRLFSATTCGASTTYASTQAAIYTSPPAAQWLGRAPLSQGAPVPGTYAFSVSTGLASCASVTLPLPSPMPAPLYLAVAFDGRRGSPAQIAVDTTCAPLGAGAGSLTAPADTVRVTIDFAGTASSQFDGEFLAVAFVHKPTPP